MSTPSRRRRAPTLPPWLTSRPVAAFAKVKDRSGRMVTDRSMVSLTVDERDGLARILSVAKLAGVPLTEVDVIRTAVDRLVADFDAFQANTGSASDPPMREDSQA